MLTFDKSLHKYYLTDKEIPSVSKIVSTLSEKFNTKQEANKYAKKNNFLKEDVINAWNTQNSKKTLEGSKVHDFGEEYAKWKYGLINERPRLAESQQELGVIQFWNDVPNDTELVGLERMVHCDHYGGTFDILLKTSDGKYHLRDYKTNTELYNSFGDKTLNYPFDNLSSSNYSKYIVQLNLYKYALEKTEGLTIGSMALIWLSKDSTTNKLYTKVKIPNYSDRIELLLNNMFGAY